MIRWLNEVESVESEQGIRGYMSLKGDKVITPFRIKGIHYKKLKLGLESVLNSRIPILEGIEIGEGTFVVNECDFLEVTNTDPIQKMQSYFLRSEMNFDREEAD